NDPTTLVDLRATTSTNGGPGPLAVHNLATVTGAGLPDTTTDHFNDSVIKMRPGTVITTAGRRGGIVRAVSTNAIASGGASLGGAGLVAVQVAGAVAVHKTDTEAHIDAGAKINQNNAGAGSAQGVFVDAGRRYEDVVVGAGLSVSGIASVLPIASVPILLG